MKSCPKTPGRKNILIDYTKKYQGTILYTLDKRYGTCKFLWYSVVHTPVMAAQIFFPGIFLCTIFFFKFSHPLPGFLMVRP